MKKTFAVVGLVALTLAAPAARADGWAVAFSFGTLCPPPPRPRIVYVPPPPVVVVPPVVACRPAVVVPAPVVCPPPVIVAPPVVCRPVPPCHSRVVVTFTSGRCRWRPACRTAYRRSGYWHSARRCRW